MNILSLLSHGEQEFKKIYTESLFASSKARHLYEDLFNKKIINMYDLLYTNQEEIYKTALRRIIHNSEPYEYVVGFCYVNDIKIYCQKPVLIPRVETEYIFTQQFKDLESKPINSILDICTGTGTIAILASFFFPNALIDASDISSQACLLAGNNIRSAKLEHHIKIIKSDLFENINKKYDLIVSNPPYISLKEYEKLDHRVKHYEDIKALTDFSDGLTIIKKIIIESSSFLNSNGILLLEIDVNQAEEIIDFAKKNIINLNQIRVFKDQYEKNRLIKITLN